jgi:hypothetical protein
MGRDKEKEKADREKILADKKAAEAEAARRAEIAAAKAAGIPIPRKRRDPSGKAPNVITAGTRGKADSPLTAGVPELIGWTGKTPVELLQVKKFLKVFKFYLLISIYK